MTDAGGLQHSLDGMGFAELGLAFAALGCYGLVLNGSLGVRARSIAAGCAVLAAAAFAASTDPWMTGVILVALGVAATGVFVAVVWAISALCGLATRRVPPTRLANPAEGAPQESSASRPRTRPHEPVHSV